VSAALLLLVPLRVEQLALRAPEGTRVLRAGMGPERARVAAARALAVDARAVAVAGVCAGAAPELEPGDVVCATELRRDGAEPVQLGPNTALVAALERRGLRVYAGPVVSTDRLTSAEQRERLAATGAIAVDMESAWLAGGAGGRPFAAVRVVADSSGRRLADPRMLAEGSRALLALRRVAAALGEWAESAVETPKAVGEPVLR
jgi:4-hydroxy-3-methylbut-2-en-1-yl diphosphate reductase